MESVEEFLGAFSTQANNKSDVIRISDTNCTMSSSAYNACVSETDTAGNDNDDEGVNLSADLYMNVLYCCIGIVGVSGNALVASVLLYFKSMRRNVTNTFIINQSFIDGSVSLIVILSAFLRDVTAIPSLIGQEIFCRVWLTNLFIWGLFVSSTYNMLAVTFERYAAIVYPLSHNHYFTRKKALFILAGVWIVGPGFNAAYMIPSSGMINGTCTVYSLYPSENIRTAVGIITVLLQYFIPLGLIIFAYSRILIVLTKATPSTGSGKKKQNEPQNTTSGNRDAIITRARKNVVKTLALVSACFVFCWSWNQIYYTMYNCGFDADFNSPFYHFTVIMVFCNCCINPIIYAAKYEQFQKGLRRIVCGGKMERSQSELATVTSRVSEASQDDAVAEKSVNYDPDKNPDLIITRL